MDWGAIGTASGLTVVVIGALSWFIKRSTDWDNHLKQCNKDQEARLAWQEGIDGKMQALITEGAATRKGLDDCWRVLMHDSQSRSPYYEMRSPLKLKEGVECSICPEIQKALEMYDNSKGSGISLLSYLTDAVGITVITKNAKECKMNIFEFIGYLEEKAV